jgi:YYY domain-containing protein
MEFQTFAVELLRWWLVSLPFVLIGWWPAQLLLGRLPAAAAALARPLGLLLIGTLSWWIAMLGLGGLSSAGVGLLTIGAAGTALATKLRSSSNSGGPRWRELIVGELVFSLVLIFTALLRSHEPTPWGTERAMDFAFFNAIQQSAHFPPADPWLSGYSINYYYFGYLLMSLPALLSGLPAAAAYNLSLALLAAMTAQGVFGLVTALLRSLQRRPGRRLERGLALSAVVSVLLLGNQAGALQVLLGDERVSALNGGELVSLLAQRMSGGQTLVIEPPLQAHDFGLVAGWQVSERVDGFNWWQPSRALWDSYADGERRPTITEFAFFSLRLGDMHPHVMALPFAVLALASGLATVLQPVEPRSWGGRRWLTALVLGVLYPLNSWEVPAYILLYAAALALAYRRQATGGRVVWREYLTDLLRTLGLALLVFAPFYLTVRGLGGGRPPLLDWPLIGTLSSMLGLYPGTRTGWHSLVILYGPLLLAAAALLVRSTWRVAAVRSWLWLPLGLLPAALWIGWPTLVLFGLGLAAAAALIERPRDETALLLLPALLGTAIVFGVDLIYIRDVFEGFSARMNTIFKFSYQVLLIWAVVLPPALWWLSGVRGRLQRAGYGLLVAAVLLLIGGGLVYPLLSLRQILRNDAIGLVGATPREQTAAGAASLAWLREQTARGSVVLEAPAVDNSEEVVLQGAAARCGGSYNYDGYGGVSAVTGRATLLGWEGHQRQWRGGDAAAIAELAARCAAADAVYRSGDAERIAAIVAQYGIDYIYVGGLEQRVYLPEQLAAITRVGTVVFAQDDVTIYAVGAAPQ